jgi:hypothetical protein
MFTSKSDQYDPYEEAKKRRLDWLQSLPAVSIFIGVMLVVYGDFALIEPTPIGNLRTSSFTEAVRRSEYFLPNVFGFGAIISALFIGVFVVISAIVKNTWRYSNKLHVQFLSTLEQFRPRKKEHLFDSVVVEWLAIGNEMNSMMKQGQSIAGLANTREAQIALRQDLRVLLPIFEKEREKAIHKKEVSGFWVSWFNDLIEYIARSQAQLERELSTGAITTTKKAERLSTFSGVCAITSTGQKATSVTLRLDEPGEFEIYRRDGKSRQHLMTVRSGETANIEISPPAESGRLEIVRKEDGEFDTISLS